MKNESKTKVEQLEELREARAQEAREESDARFRLMFQKHSSVMLLIEVTSGRIVDANDAAVEFYGYPRSTLTGMGIQEINQLDPEEVALRRDQAAAGSQTSFVFPHKLASGQVRTVEVHSSQIEYEGQEILFSIVHDITDRKQAEQALWSQKMFMDNVIDCLWDTVYIFNREDGVGTRWNKVLEELSGYDYEKMRFYPPTHFYPEEEHELIAGFGEQIEEHGRAKLELTYIIADGSRIPFEYVVSPVAGPDGEDWMCAIGRDISERKQAEAEKRSLEQQLLQSRKMEAVGRLAGGIAHDFNNLLTVISAYSGFLEAALPDGSPMRADVQEIKDAGKRATTLTRQLLAFSRRQTLEPRVLDLNEVVVGVVKILDRLIGEDIEFSASMDDEVCRINADPSQIEQLVMNLAINARDAMPNGGTLGIATAAVELDDEFARVHLDCAAGSYVKLTVTDSGAGMTASVRERIFEPFFTTKELGRGTGLGLATVYGVAMQSGGSIRVVSEPGQGATFEVYLPRVEGDVEGTFDESDAIDIRGMGTVLVVEDERAVRELARRILADAGYEVLTAEDGEEGLAACERLADGVDVVLTDVVMPRMGGPELAERLAARFPDVTVVFMSGYTDNALGERGSLAEDTQFIAKPFTAKELLEKIREALSP